MGKMKKKILLIGFIGFQLSTFSQMGFEVGFRSGKVSSKSLDEFTNTFNAYHQSIITEPLDDLGMTYGWGAGMDYEVGGFFGALRFSDVKANTQVTYNSGGIRHFDLSQFMSTVTCGFGKNLEEFAFHLGVGMAVGKDVITSYYEYADGTMSIGKDKILNGVYEGLHFSYVADLTAAVGLGGGFMIYAHLDYLFGSFAKLDFTMDEWHWDKSLDAYYHTPEGLPLDYAEWMALQGTFTYPVDKFVKTDMNGLRFEVGLRYQLNF